jgi:hypothetical protein
VTRLEQIAADLRPYCRTPLDAAVLASDLEATPVCKRWTLWGLVYGRTTIQAADVRAWLIKHGCMTPEQKEAA